LSAFVTAAAQVTGSGTTSFVPLWTDNSTLGNSTIFETQGMIGIGTDSPTATLNVIGPDGTNGNAPTVLGIIGGKGFPGGGSGSPIQLTAGNGGNLGIGGSIGLTAGNGGEGFLGAGAGGPIVFTAGTGGTALENYDTGGGPGSIQITGGTGGRGGKGGTGGLIALQPGAGGRGHAADGANGWLLLAPSGGNVGIGESSPAHTLEIKVGGTTLADAWSVRSSRRFKTDIRPLAGALEKVEQLQGVSYNRKDDGKHEIGVVAEEVDKVIPEVVSRNPETNEVQGVDYSRLVALLIEAVKTQEAEIHQLRAQVEELRSNSVPK